MLIVVDSDENILAYINNHIEGTVTEVLNGEYIIDFVCTIDPVKTDYIYDTSNYIKYNDDLFRIVRIKELHNSDNSTTIAVSCEHLSYDLLKKTFLDFIKLNATAQEAMLECLVGTPFTLRHCDITTKTNIEYTQECNAKQISVAIANNWRGELKYYRNYIDLLASRGMNRGTGFIFGKNIENISRQIDRTDDSVSYEIQVVENSELEEFGYYELGDTVRVMDHRLDIDIEVKIVEIRKNLVTGKNSSVVLGQAIKDMRSSFGGVKQDVQEVKETVQAGATDWNKVSQIIDASGDIVIGKLNALTNIATKIVNYTGTFEQRDNGLYWQDQPTKEASTFASFWGPTGMVYATQKDHTGEWIWSAVFNGEGVIANQVTANALNVIQAHVLNLVVDSLIGKTITGVTIKGSEFVSDETTSTRSMRLTNGSIKFLENGSSRASLYQDELNLHAVNGSDQVIVTAGDNSNGRDTMKILVQGDHDFDIIQGNVQSRITMAADGGIYLQVGYGSNRDIHIGPRTTSDTVHVYGNIEVWGEKPAVVPTQHYGVRTLYCEEADRCYFSTKGISETMDGECVILIDDIFLETIELNSECPYIIQLTPYSDATVWVSNVDDYSFTVRSNKDTKFAYDLKAIRVSFANTYLEEKKCDDKRILRDVQESVVKRMRNTRKEV